MNSTTVSISSARSNLANLISQVVETQTPITIMQHSQPKAVLLDHDYYTSLEEAILDLTDAREADRAKKEPTISLQKYLKQRWG